jgi:hypothetical protein
MTDEGHAVKIPRYPRTPDREQIPQLPLAKAAVF